MPARPDAWMPLYIGDYLGDTMSLSTRQHGAYLLLLMAYWRSGAALPDDDAALAAMARLAPRAWQAERPALQRFFEVGDGLWRHKRVEQELAAAQQHQARRSEAARAAAAKRWAAPSADDGTARAAAPAAPDADVEVDVHAAGARDPHRVGERDAHVVADRVAHVVGARDAHDVGPTAADRAGDAAGMRRACPSPSSSPSPSPSPDSGARPTPAAHDHASAGLLAHWGGAVKQILAARWPDDAHIAMMPMGLVAQWAADGFELERDVLPVVRRLVADKKGGPIGNLAYFTAAIGRRHAERRAGIAAGAPDAAGGSARAAIEAGRWTARVAGFRRRHDAGEPPVWLAEWGPPPSEPGCRAPRAVLAAHSFAAGACDEDGDDDGSNVGDARDEARDSDRRGAPDTADIDGRDDTPIDHGRPGEP